MHSVTPTIVTESDDRKHTGPCIAPSSRVYVRIRSLR